MKNVKNLQKLNKTFVTDGPTVTYRVACTRLKSLFKSLSITHLFHLQDDQRSSGEECLDDLDSRRARLPSPLGSTGGGSVGGGMGGNGVGNGLESLSGFGSLALVGGPSEADVVGADAERFSRKVFVGGLPPDIDEEEITASFRRFGPLVVDWPHKAESKSYFPPKVRFLGGIYLSELTSQDERLFVGLEIMSEATKFSIIIKLFKYLHNIF